jgi:hypothetical protein
MPMSNFSLIDLTPLAQAEAYMSMGDENNPVYTEASPYNLKTKSGSIA